MAFRTDVLTVFHGDPSRGSNGLQEILTEALAGVIGSDFILAYRKLMREAPLIVQRSVTHMIRGIWFPRWRPHY